MALEKDLNVPPYFDDYDEDKNFYKILYRPSTAVQARELTQSQTILQNQIERFGNHVFKDGSIVEGVAITYLNQVQYISLEDSFNTNTDFIVSELDSTYLITNSTESSNAVRAVVRISKDGIKASAPNTNRIYVDYIVTGTDANDEDVNHFIPGETLYIYNSNQNKFGTLDANNLVDTINTLSTNATFTSNGASYCISVSDGIIYQKGFFIKVDPQIINVRDFSTDPTGYVVGFNTVETIVDENEDSSLNDNALGYSNENAPGAHRLKLTPTLVAKPYSNNTSNTTFFAIVEFDGNEPTEQRSNSNYNQLEKQFAVKTYEESGDYVINRFTVESRVNSSNSQTFYYEVSPGVAYIRGYRVEKIGPTKIETFRATTTEVASNQLITANYGNYVICNELIGSFDTEQLGEIDLYDRLQTSITDAEGVSATPSGNIVGKANIKAVVFEDGLKGTSTATYLIYLTNIRMNSGKSFTSDVKSLYSSSLGGAKADIVLENGVAVLKESTKATSIFDSGLFSIKRLTNNTGIGDTTFTYNQIKTGTLTTTGAVTITIDTIASGAANERLTSSSNVTSTTGLSDYNIYLTAAAYTANLTGNVVITSSSNVVTSNGATFTSNLVNSLLRITDGSNNYIRKVTSVTNTTYLTVDINIPSSNNNAKYQKYYVAGTPLPLSNVTISSNTTFIANFGETLDSGTQTVYCSYPVFRNEATAIPKVINKNVFVKIDCSNNVSTSVGPWNLGLADVHKIRNVYVGTTYSNTNPERSSWFELDNGQRDDLYDHARLFVLPQYASEISGSTKLLVELDHFTANTSSSVGFFSVESYPIDDVSTANTNAIKTIEIPVYNNKELRNYIDFRIIKANTAVSTTTIASSTINPAVNNSSFSIPASGQHMIYPDTNFTADIEYYLPRIDILSVDSSGTFNVNKGVPNIKPRPPFVDSDQIVIAESFVPAYPSATQREFELYKNIPSIKISLKQNRRYTMKDIGVIDDRLKRLEYYTVLSTVEQQARDLTIPDANGLDRFKNGIFADPFNSHNIGNVTDFEYKIAIDQDNSIARPYIDKQDIDFQYISNVSTDSVKSSNVTRISSLVLLNYNHETFARQRFATKYRNAAQSLWKWNGFVDLYPSIDFFRDERPKVNVNQTLDIAAPWEAFKNTPFASIYGDWRTISTQVNSQSNTVLNGFLQTTTTTTTNRTNQERIIQQLGVNTFTETLDFGSTVKDFSVQPYMRSRLVAFIAKNLKPNTTLHVFFDDVNVDEHCAPGELSGLTTVSEGQEDRIVNKKGDFGDTLVSDSNGFVCGIFRIPAETFRTGDRYLQITNIDDIKTGDDARMTTAKARYTADSTSITRQSTTLNVKQPLVFGRNIIDRRTQISSSTVVSVVDLIPQPPNDVGGGGSDGPGGDPIAQSFSISNIPDTASGIFLTKVGVYFKTKSPALGCTLFVCEMTNNFPDMSKVLGKGFLETSSINVSEDGTSETVFELDYPVFLLKNNDYCFVVQPVANSPEYNIWCAETGNFDIATNEQVFVNPSVGTLFFSANRKTWTDVQLEDIKYNLYRAKFTSNSGYAIFKNENDEYLTINSITKANNSLSIEIGDIVYTVNSSANTANTANLVSYTLKANSTNGFPSGRVQWYDDATGKIWLDSSNGGFSNTSNPTIAIYRTRDYSNLNLITANTLIGYANVLSVDNLDYHAVVPKFGIMKPLKTSVDFEYKGTKSSAYTLDTEYLKVENENDFELLDSERYIVSKSNEVVSMTGDKKSAVFKINLSSESEFTSPVIDLSRKSMLFIENLINNDDTNEHTRYGNALSKYVSKRVILADGQEAEDLKVYLTAYRPADSNIKVYAKFWNNYDSEDFDTKIWSELQYDNGGEFVYSSPTNVRDYKEYEFSVPSINSVAYGAFANAGTISYNTLAGGISIGDSNTVITSCNHSFNANTGVNNTNETIAITNANTYFRVDDYITYYTASGNTVISGLANNTSYYVTFANTTRIALSTTRGGSNVNLTASSTSETGHFIYGTRFLEDFEVGDQIRVQSNTYVAIRNITSISNNTYMTVDKGLEQTNTAGIYYVFNQGGGDGIVEYQNSSDSRFVGYKEFAIKIILLSSNPINIPRLNDVRAIALQV